MDKKESLQVNNKSLVPLSNNGTDLFSASINTANKQKNKRKEISPKTQKNLLLSSGGVCAICHAKLVISDKKCSLFDNVVEFAHIYPVGNEGPRCEETLVDKIKTEFIDSYENLILLCPTCHTKIDKMPSQYSAKELIVKKIEHEKWVLDKLSDKTSSLSFAELDVICKAIVNNDCIDENLASNFDVINITDKISKNNLSTTTQNNIKVGLSRADYIDEYLNSQFDPNFTPNLIKRFKDIYVNLKKEFNGDMLYKEMLSNISPSFDDFSIVSAANSVLSYLFHECEVFEK